MQFSSLAEFIAMEGHGFYVWVSYGFTVAVFALLIMYSFAQHKSTINQIKRRYKREQKLKKAAQAQENEVIK